MNTDTPLSSPQSLNTFVTTQLNDAQRTAVHHENGSILIVAGAGSGKTRVITTRITHIIQERNIAPTSIIALTFTNKAATEMKERIEQFLGEGHPLPFIGTFHSYCVRLLRQNNALLETPFMGILDDDDQQKILQGIVKRSALDKKVTAKQLSYQISQIKNEAMDPTKHELYLYNPLLQEIYHAYEHEKTMSKSLDFDDLLIHAVKLFTKNPEFKAEFHKRIRHILIDEYQDTNVIQHALLKQMALEAPGILAVDSICAVGDEDQSIYSWRGATVANIMNFTQDFPNTAIIKIEQNYRSVQPILDAANNVIKHNKIRNPKNLWSDKKGKDRIRVLSCLSEYQEADAITHYIKAITRSKKSKHSCAIVYRTHFQSRAIEEALVKQGIPYKIIGGIQFYERKEIKDMLAYLKLVANPFDRISLLRVINCPLRGLGNKFEELVYERWNLEPFLSFKALINIMIKEELVTGAKKEAVTQFLSIFEAIPSDAPTSKALETIIQKSDYFGYLKESADSKEESFTRIDNVKELLEAILHVESQGVTTIDGFLEQVALMQDQIKKDESEKEKDPVLLMSLHAAKGLEFETVIISGFEDGLLPSSRSLSDEQSLEEERRLLYVGITRAQERLLLTYSRYRYQYGTMSEQRASRFLREIPEHLAPASDCSYWNAAQFMSYFAGWMGGVAPKQNTVMTFGAPKKIAETTVEKPVSSLKKNQPVTHKTFGTGIVQAIEERGGGTVYVTVKFKQSTKKIDQKFVTVL